jgi:hypothetical protein
VDRGRILSICFVIVNAVYIIQWPSWFCNFEYTIYLVHYWFCSYLPYHLTRATSHCGEVGSGGCFLQLRAWQLALSWFGGSPSTLILSWQLDGCASNLILTQVFDNFMLWNVTEMISIPVFNPKINMHFFKCPNYSYFPLYSYFCSVLSVIKPLCITV